MLLEDSSIVLCFFILITLYYKNKIKPELKLLKKNRKNEINNTLRNNINTKLKFGNQSRRKNNDFLLNQT